MESYSVRFFSPPPSTFRPSCLMDILGAVSSLTDFFLIYRPDCALSVFSPGDSNVGFTKDNLPSFFFTPCSLWSISASLPSSLQLFDLFQWISTISDRLLCILLLRFYIDISLSPLPREEALAILLAATKSRPSCSPLAKF